HRGTAWAASSIRTVETGLGGRRRSSCNSLCLRVLVLIIPGFPASHSACTPCIRTVRRRGPVTLTRWDDGCVPVRFTSRGGGGRRRYGHLRKSHWNRGRPPAV